MEIIYFWNAQTNNTESDGERAGEKDGNEDREREKENKLKYDKEICSASTQV